METEIVVELGFFGLVVSLNASKVIHDKQLGKIDLKYLTEFQEVLRICIVGRCGIWIISNHQYV